MSDLYDSTTNKRRELLASKNVSQKYIIGKINLAPFIKECLYRYISTYGSKLPLVLAYYSLLYNYKSNY